MLFEYFVGRVSATTWWEVAAACRIRVSGGSESGDRK